MAAKDGRGKKAHPRGAARPAQEKGVCIICGMEKTGTPAALELPVRAARRLRAALSQPPRHTVACSECLGEAKERRAKYEKKVQMYLLGAFAFFVLVIAGSIMLGRADASAIFPALLGGACVALLPHIYYFPSFKN